MSESWDSPRKSKLMAVMPLLHICHLIKGAPCQGGKKKATSHVIYTQIMFHFSGLTFLFHA